MSWLDALFGKLKNNGAEVEARGALNFNGGLKIGVNNATETNDVSLDTTRVDLAPTGPGTEVGQSWTWNGSVWVPSRGVIRPHLVPAVYAAYDDPAVVAAATANTAAITAAIVAAYLSGGRSGVVELPDGAYDVYGPFNVLYGVTLCGPEKGFNSGHRVFNDGSGLPQIGTLLRVRSTGPGTNSTRKLFTPKHQSSLRCLEIHYPDQEIDATPDAYDWTVYIASNEPGATVERITSQNPYKFLYADSPAHVEKVYACPLFEGVHLQRIAEQMICADVRFNNISYDHGATLIAWIAAHRRAFVVEQAEAFSFARCFALGSLIGIDFTIENTPDASGAYGEWIGGGFDATQYPVVVNATTALSGAGFKIIGASIVPTAGGNAFTMQDTVNISSAPVLQVLATSIHGTHSRHAWAKSGSAAYFTAVGGTWEGSVDQGTLNDSASAVIDLDHVRMPTATIRTDGVGTNYDTNPRAV